MVRPCIVVADDDARTQKTDSGHNTLDNAARVSPTRQLFLFSANIAQYYPQ
jgi:hypothetical protein